MLFPVDDNNSKNDSGYLVFARKYRPLNFDTLIGQSHLIEILSNAFSSKRIAHAYVLTGVRGVGKTTTARILAKGFNCTGTADNPITEPTLKPCGVCNNCISITAGKNIDVYEMDAASRTGINDIREIIDSLPYKPLTCRYKVFIIDEVHMLSTAAFNGLLKTLEEPPAHVKFIFATTEIHKIPATVLSRCQKIDLKRVDVQTLTNHFEHICHLENIECDIVALARIARAADGSVRDGLSLLDQAVAKGAGKITLESIADMFGGNYADDCLEILQACFDYNAPLALELWHKLYSSGCDASVFTKEFIRLIEWVMRFKLTPVLANDISLSETMRQTASELATKTPVPLLSRMWEISVKITEILPHVPDSYAACEMMLIRCVYGMNIPDIRALETHTPQAEEDEKKKPLILNNPVPSEKKSEEKIEIATSLEVITPLETFEALLEFLSNRRQLDLKHFLMSETVLKNYGWGTLEVQIFSEKPKLSEMNVRQSLGDLTQIGWRVSFELVQKKDETVKTHLEQIKEQKQDMIEQIKGNNLIVKEILKQFPDVQIDVKTL